MLLHSHVDIQLIRRWFTERTSIGELFYPPESGRNCYILEDVARAPDVKIQNVTCIPSGDYWLKITESKRFGRLLPLIFNEEYYKHPVTGVEYYDLIRFAAVIFTGVRMHPGNVDTDTDACQLPGRVRITNRVAESKLAFDPLFDKMFAQIGTAGKLNYRITHNQAA